MQSKKKKNKRISKTKKISRAKYQCPPRLAEIIYWSNLVPPNTDLELASEIESQLDKKYSLEYGVESIKETDEKTFAKFLIEYFDTCYKDFSESFKNEFGRERFEVILNNNPSAEQLKTLQWLILESIQRYKTIREIRQNLYYFAEQLEERRTLLNPYFMDSFTFAPTTKNIEISIVKNEEQVEIVEVEMPLQVFVDAIKGIYIDRLRLCVICSRVFWAKRKDSETCSVSCFNTLRQRRHRDRNKEALNAKRVENYKYKKERKKKMDKLQDRH
jgi:predicted nucleic acid-binding Zn ribbon protein